MTNAVIVDAVRTAGGRRNGKLHGWHAVDLAAEPLKAIVERNDLDPGVVDDVERATLVGDGDRLSDRHAGGETGAGALCAVAGDGDDGPVRNDRPHPVVGGIGDVDGPVTGDRDAGRPAQPGVDCGAAVSGCSPPCRYRR